MKTQVKIDLTTLFTEEKPEHFFLVSSENAITELAEKKPAPAHTENLIICPNCKKSHYIKKGKKQNGAQRFKCKECGKYFSLLLKSVNVQLMFKTYYEEQNKGNPSMLNTISRKIHACLKDERYRMCFNQLLSEYELKGEAPERCIALAFNGSNRMIDRREWGWLQRQVDNWHFFLNFNDTDVSYLTLDLNQKLVRNHNITLSSQQDPAQPLLYCAECTSSNIVRHGFNHTPRRQIRCLNCDTVSIIRVENIITFDYFRETFKHYLKKSYNCPFVIDNIFNDMHHEFYDTKLHDYFQTVVDRTMIITQETKQHMFKLFLQIYDERVALQARFSRQFDPYPELKDEKRKLIELLSNPRAFERYHPLLFHWEENTIRAYNKVVNECSDTK